MKDGMVKLDGVSHDILKRWKKKLRDQGVRVSLGATIREMDILLKDEEIGFSKTDLRVAANALGKLKEISQKYDDPSFSSVIVKMNSMLKKE